MQNVQIIWNVVLQALNQFTWILKDHNRQEHTFTNATSTKLFYVFLNKHESVSMVVIYVRRVIFKCLMHVEMKQI